METMKRRERRTRRHAERLGVRALRGTGKIRDVADVLGRSPGRAGHNMKDEAHPTVRDFVSLVLTMSGSSAIRLRPVLEALEEAVELNDILRAPTATLIDRGLYLLDHENDVGAHEDRLSMVGAGHSDALREVAEVSRELAAIIDELAARAVDLHALYRERAAAA